MKLRDYQTDLVNLTRSALAHGNRRVLSVLPCGGGKSAIFTHMAHEHVKRGGYVHIYVHRRELLEQTTRTLINFGVVSDNIYVGMIQSRTEPPFAPTMIIYDEAHHATAGQWSKVSERYPTAYVIGLTATPKRTDGATLRGAFDTLVEGVTADWLIDNHYLAPYDYYAPKLTTLNPKDILINRGSDYDQQAVGDIMLKSKIYGDVAKYLDPTRKTIIYAPSIALSESLSALGVVHIDGTTPKAERDRIISEFRAGKIMWLSNVDLFGEGFDIPDCSVVIMLRPTKSTVLFIQQSMRALRYVEGKRATIYDLVGNVFTHGLPTTYDSWSLDGTLRKSYHQENEVSVRMCESCYRVYKGNDPLCPYCKHDNGKTQAEIKADQRAELERIEIERKRNERKEQGMANTLQDLIELGKKRGYKNPTFWAKKILQNRRKL